MNQEDKYAARRWDAAGYETIDAEVLETIDYEYPGRRIEVEYRTLEFTAVCPWTGLPDYADLVIRYVPDRTLIELKSLKYYLHSYRNVGILQEHAVNRILDDLVRLCSPQSMTVEGRFNARGGLDSKVTSVYERPPAGK